MTSLRSLSWIVPMMFVAFACAMESEPAIGEDSFAAQCDPGYSVEDGACVAPSFTDIYQSLILTKCKGCHVQKAMGGLSFAQPELAYKNLVSIGADKSGPCAKTKMMRVTPGNADTSLFFKKLYKPSLCGQTMPVGGSLEPLQIDRVEAWIQEGAAF